MSACDALLMAHRQSPTIGIVTCALRHTFESDTDLSHCHSLRHAFGTDIRDAGLSFDQFVSGLKRHSRRPVKFGRPEEPFLTTDEMRVVRWLTACQQQWNSCEKAHAEWFLRKSDSQTACIIATAAELSDFLLCHGQILPSSPEHMVARHPRPLSLVKTDYGQDRPRTGIRAP